MECSSVSPVIAIRSLVLSRLSSIDCDPRDVVKVTNDDWFVRRFLPPDQLEGEDGSDNNNELPNDVIEKSAKALEEHLVWRKENRINDLCDSDFPIEFNRFVRFDEKKGIIYAPIKYIHYVDEWMPLFMSYFAFILEKLHRATGSRRVIAIADLRDAGLANLDVHWFLKFKAIRNANYPNLFKRVYIYEANWALRIVVNSIMKLLPKKYCKLFATLVFDDAKEMLGDDLPNFMGGQKNLMGIRDGKSLKEVALDNGICEASYEKMHGYLSIDNNNND